MTVRTGWISALALAATAALTPAAPTADAVGREADAHRRVRGMTISCQGAGRIWGSDEMVESMAELKAMGVNWITIHPYAAIREDGTVGGSRMDSLYDDPVWLTRPIREAHRLGLKIMIKPHIAYWGSSFEWRGRIRFDTEDEWRRFFDTYERWITMVADLTRQADAFVVGTELEGTTHREAEWRRIIASVRTRLSTPLTYAANWDKYDKVPFWDALDAIGIQSYFPLVDHDDLPTQRELNRSWRQLVEQLESFGRTHRRNVILAELGYNRSAQAAVRPWEYRTGGEHADEIQRRCMHAALDAIDDSEVVSGAFLWKWFAGSRGRRGNFLMSTPEMKTVIRDQWADEVVDAAVP
ncbi:MAG: hypothetical protein GY715_08045 [Planctomycetes bacterium]|nr:hypothetical protein [Planctomycetota bacterium]